MNITLPHFSPEELQSMSDDSLLALVTSLEDLLPRTVVDECIRRGDALVPALRAHLEDEQNWCEEADPGDWWALLHAIMILGAIPGRAASEALLSGFRRMEAHPDDTLWDWVAGYWPALFANKRELTVDALRAIALDTRQNWYCRIQALECVLAAAHAAGHDALEAALDWIAELTRDENEDFDFRSSAANILLDFPRERHRRHLEALGSRMEKMNRFGAAFHRDDVIKTFKENRDQPEWERFSDPWEFYDEQAIRDRQARWAREAAEEAASQEAVRASASWQSQTRQPQLRDAPKIGRNEPCPCGSGKKYKKCCLAKAQEKPAELNWHRLRRVIDGLPQQMIAFSEDHYGPQALEAAWTVFVDNPARPFLPDDPLIPVFMPWFLYYWKPSLAPGPATALSTAADQPPAAAFLASAASRRLDPLARDYVENALQAPFSFYDVKSSRPGQSLTLHDVLTGETLEVLEHSASQTLRPGDILLAQPVRVKDITVLECCGPVAIPPRHKKKLVELRKRWREEYGALDRHTLASLALDILHCYQALVAELTLDTMPELQNTDGEALRPQELVFEIPSPQAAFDALWPLSLQEGPQSLLQDAEYDEAGALHKVVFPWLKEGNARHKSWRNTILGNIRIKGTRLTIEVNSDERAARMREEVEKRLGDQARYRGTVLHSVEKMLADGAARGGKDQAPEPLPPELQEKLLEITEAHWNDWIHEKIPALGDMTPLEAAKDPEGRELLEALLLEIQRKRLPQLPDYDPVPRLRARLGLEKGEDTGA